MQYRRFNDDSDDSNDFSILSHTSHFKKLHIWVESHVDDSHVVSVFSDILYGLLPP